MPKLQKKSQYAHKVEGGIRIESQDKYPESCDFTGELTDDKNMNMK